MNATRYSNGELVGFSEKTNGNGLREYTNMEGKIQIMVVLSNEERIIINVFDIQGRLLYHDNPLCSSGYNLVEIGLGPKGLYIVQVKSKNAESSFKVLGSDLRKTSFNLLQNSASTLKIEIDTIVLSHNSRYCFDYNNDHANGDNFGKLYTSLSALNVESSFYNQPVQGICPQNWHVASDDDWIHLEIEAGMDSNQAIYGFYHFRGLISPKLRSVGTQYWYFADGTDDFGFSARGSGAYWRNSDGWGFSDLTQTCTWWTYRFDGLMIRQLRVLNAGVWRSYAEPDQAVSVRCVRN
jgi:uncharacterized protein (TIGR02145 family)